MWAGGRIGFCYRQGCDRFGVGVCFGSGHHLDGLVQSTYGSRLPFGIQRDEEGNPRMSRTWLP